MRRHDDADGSIHERRPREAREFSERDRLLRPDRRAADLRRRAGRDRDVRPHHEIRIEHSEQAFEVASAQGCKKGIDDLSLSHQIGVGRYRTAAHTTSRPAGELTRCGLGTADDRRDFIERQREHVVQHEGEALCRCQSVEDH